MKRTSRLVIVATLGVAAAYAITTARATDRFFRDITSLSPNGQYKVEARSPDNQRKGHRAFQANFTYTCTDTKAGKVLWTRRQPMGEPQEISYGSSTPFTIQFPKEASPIDIFVNDAGWTVIRTGWDELIVVGRDGKDRGKIDILDDAFTEEEKKKHVHQTTAGPMWSGKSRWYFAKPDGKGTFVVRTAWGTYVVMDLQSGKLVKNTKASPGEPRGG